MNYYKLPISSEAGQRLAAIMTKEEECEAAAHALAEEVGATSYISDDNNKGGILAFEFPKTFLADDHQWTKQEDDAGPLYMPRVEIKTETMESSKAEGLSKDPNTIVSQQEYTFEQIKGQYSRSEAAQMAGVELSTPDPRNIMQEAGFNNQQIGMILMGAPIEQVVPDIDSNVRFALGSALHEDQCVSELLADRRYRMVQTVVGPRKAQKLYIKMQQLPVIPADSAAKLLQLVGSHSPMIVADNKYYYIGTSGECLLSELQPCKKRAFEEVLLATRQAFNSPQAEA